MKLSDSHSMNLRLAVFAVALILSAPAAHAFTIETQRGFNADGSTKFSDPEDKAKNFANGGTDASQGGFTFHFDGATSDPTEPSNGGYPRAMNNPYYLSPQNWAPQYWGMPLLNR